MIRRLLNPIFQRQFHDDSYGFRPGRSCHQAVERVLELRRQGYDHVLDADISGFFDPGAPGHRAVMTQLSAVIADGNILNLVVLRKIPQGWSLGRGQVAGDASRHAARRSRLAAAGESRRAGTLNVLDWHLHERGFRFVRYADDFVVLCQSESQAKEARIEVESRRAGTA